MLWTRGYSHAHCPREGASATGGVARLPPGAGGPPHDARAAAGIARVVSLYLVPGCRCPDRGRSRPLDERMSAGPAVRPAGGGWRRGSPLDPRRVLRRGLPVVWRADRGSLPGHLAGSGDVEGNASRWRRVERRGRAPYPFGRVGGMAGTRRVSGGRGRSCRSAEALLGTRASSPPSSFPRKRKSKCPGSAGVPPANEPRRGRNRPMRARRPRSQEAMRARERRRVSEAHGRCAAAQTVATDCGGRRRMLWERRVLWTRMPRLPSSFPRKRESKCPGNACVSPAGGGSRAWTRGTAPAPHEEIRIRSPGPAAGLRERGGEGGPDRTFGHGVLGTRALPGGPCVYPEAPGGVGVAHE